MRWSGQEIGVVDHDALPGLGAMSSLVRSVQTPEFAGVTFHEVLAKSALNHVPGSSSALPFGWTINPYRGCLHQCTFCLDPETLILMADGRQKPLWQVRPGDEIIGTRVEGSYRRYVRTTVRDAWKTRKRAYRITLADGTEIVASGDHRFLTDRGWKYVTGAMAGRDRRPYLTLQNELMGFGMAGLPQDQQPAYFSEDYRRGYLTGMVKGDGMIFHGTYADARRVRVIHRFRLALADTEALHRSRLYLSMDGVETSVRPFIAATDRHRAMTAIHTAKAADVARVETVTTWPDTRSDGWRAGFLAGVFDAEGSYSRGVLRIANSDERILTETESAFRAFGFDVIREPARVNGVASVRLRGGVPAHQRFFTMVGPAISRKLSLEGRAVKSSADLRVVGIEPLGESDLIDISTGTGDFIANGVISHNCFARQTHTYLDFDAGRDFDTQIVVKVNVAEVLQKELARPSWQRPHVALGTNTDPYQRAEGRYRLMPGIIAALAASGTPFSVLTKGTLLRRDLPLLQEAAERVPVQLAMTIDMVDPELRASVEPGAPSAEARLATVRAATEAGFDVSVLVMPVLPYLTDSISHLDQLLGMIAEAGATQVAYTALHLRSGAREWYLAWIEREHPELLPRYLEMYGRTPYAPKEYRAWLAARIRPLLRKHGLDRRPRMDPTTGTPAPEPRSPRFDGFTTGHEMPSTGLIAAELSPEAAAALQPTLF
jgi:DNA repair photolyase